MCDKHYAVEENKAHPLGTQALDFPSYSGRHL